VNPGSARGDAKFLGHPAHDRILPIDALQRRTMKLPAKRLQLKVHRTNSL
jgi:hypothetical protein